MKKLLVFIFSFLLFAYLSINNVYALTSGDFPALCQGGMYDYCSQAPKCGEYPEWNSAWEQRSAALWNPEIFEFCQYKICQGYVPLCCYEMVATGDKDKCAGYDTLYCLPKQCDQVAGSAGKQCAHGARGNFGKKCDIESLNPIDLQLRFPNDVLFKLIDELPNSAIVKAVPTKYPDLWNKYLAYKAGGSPTPNPIPTATLVPGQPTRTPTPTILPTPSPTLLPGQPTYTPTPTLLPGQPTHTSAPVQPTVPPILGSPTFAPSTASTSSGFWSGIIQFTGWTWLSETDPLFMTICLILVIFLIRLFTH